MFNLFNILDVDSIITLCMNKIQLKTFYSKITTLKYVNMKWVCANQQLRILINIIHKVIQLSSFEESLRSLKKKKPCFLEVCGRVNYRTGYVYVGYINEKIVLTQYHPLLINWYKPKFELSYVLNLTNLSYVFEEDKKEYLKKISYF